MINITLLNDDFNIAMICMSQLPTRINRANLCFTISASMQTYLR